MRLSVVATGLERLSVEDQYHRRIAAMALNRAAREMRTQVARDIRDQVAFPASYLSPRGGRLYVGLTAHKDRLAASIRARFRPTSLARFLVSGSLPGQPRKLTRIRVRPGTVKAMGRAFPVRLRRGTALTDTQHNLGVAIRLRPGEVVHNKKQMVRFSRKHRNLYLLYGPSVQQAALAAAGTGVFKDRAAMAAEKVVAEYIRLLNVKGLFSKRRAA